MLKKTWSIIRHFLGQNYIEEFPGGPHYTFDDIRYIKDYVHTLEDKNARLNKEKHSGVWSKPS